MSEEDWKKLRKKRKNASIFGTGCLDTVNVQHTLSSRPFLGVRVVCVSDTHGMHSSLPDPLPDGEILVHAGDFSPNDHIIPNISFPAWLQQQSSRFQYVFVVEGNHDPFAFTNDKEFHTLPDNVRLLSYKGETVEVKNRDGNACNVRVYGTRFFAYPLQIKKGTNIDLYKEKKDKIETEFHRLLERCQEKKESVDILINHVPPLAILDWNPKHERSQGCEVARKFSREIKPRLFVCGHVHADHGVSMQGDTVYVNAANCLSPDDLGWGSVIVEI